MGFRFNDFEIPDHMQDGVRNYIEHGIPPGSFLTAVIQNDLSGAVAHADATNMHNIPAYAAYFYNEAPAACWGSREKMDAWLAKFRAAA